METLRALEIKTQLKCLSRTSRTDDINDIINDIINDFMIICINDHILVKDHDAHYEDFLILLNKSNVFKLHWKESLLIKKDQPEHNINIYGYPLELLD